MRFEKSDAVADEGVAAVNMLFSREPRWIFREVSKRDVGVDAQVEVCLRSFDQGSARFAFRFRSQTRRFKSWTRNHRYRHSLIVAV
jgi:hypothetical protein